MALLLMRAKVVLDLAMPGTCLCSTSTFFTHISSIALIRKVLAARTALTASTVLTARTVLTYSHLLLYFSICLGLDIVCRTFTAIYLISFY